MYLNKLKKRNILQTNDRLIALLFQAKKRERNAIQINRGVPFYKLVLGGAGLANRELTSTRHPA